MQRRKNESGWTSAKVLSEALPFIQRHSGRWVVVKFGGHAMGSPELTAEFAKDIVLLRQCGLRPVVVHGGGPQIGTMLERLQIKTQFKDGLRVSDMETVGVAEMVLSGAINKSIVSAINEPTGTDVTLIETLASDDAGFIPVVSPISADGAGRGYNINADTAAGVLASALGASRLMLLTDIEGVMDGDGNVLTDLSVNDARGLIEQGVAKGGMIPKLTTAIDAVQNDVEAVVILDGRRAHGLLVELFTDMGAGTLIR